mgnify:CR=1 FL=1
MKQASMFWIVHVCLHLLFNVDFTLLLIYVRHQLLVNSLHQSPSDTLARAHYTYGSLSYSLTHSLSRSLTHLFIFGIHYLSVGFIEGSVSICRSYVSRFCRSFCRLHCPCRIVDHCRSCHTNLCRILCASAAVCTEAHLHIHKTHMIYAEAIQNIMPQLINILCFS